MKATPEYGHVQARSANFAQYNAILTETEIGDAWGVRWSSLESPSVIATHPDNA